MLYDMKVVTSIKHSLKYSYTWLEIKPRSYWNKSNALTTEPNTVNSEIFAKALFFAKQFRENKTLAIWLDHSVADKGKSSPGRESF